MKKRWLYILGRAALTHVQGGCQYVGTSIRTLLVISTSLSGEPSHSPFSFGPSTLVKRHELSQLSTLEIKA